MEYAIAVIDIGMTNKKVAIYDEQLHQLEAHYRTFDPVPVNNCQTHDLAAIEDWFITELQHAAAKYPIRAIAITTHGATFVCVGPDGKPSVPCVYYTHEPGEAFHQEFYARFGMPEELQAKTGTPYFKALINPAKGIFFAQKQFPEAFQNTVYILNYPQYWGYRFTGVVGAENTYVGCHTYLWDWTKAAWSSVAQGLGITSLLPRELKHSWDILGTITPEIARKTGLSTKTIVTMGIHDSNASLLPHFAKKGRQGFVLNSTGTWCVIMNPVTSYGFNEEELGKVVFFNQSAFGTPVKTAIFLGGYEFETWLKVLQELHQRQDIPPYRQKLYQTLLARKDTFLLPELTAGSGQFPGSHPRVIEKGKAYHYGDILTGTAIPPCFSDYERGIAVLRISLVMQTLTALDRTGMYKGQEIFTEGGFRKNEAYNVMLSAALPENPLALTDIAEATAFGAAMTAKMALTDKSLEALKDDFTVQYQEVPKTALPELADYRQAWIHQIEGNKD
ncbi:FGGY-family carbohydrate kinase [Gracilinema caldarium]|uniref:Carbohydrate kinase, FGGY n=1 Tax=Gracilinema caldarium (strain ATCC 51460 / DSM 7334 / H1) TaxID=744872 RepID=F8EXV1_GRAC1|nr:FGGY family carbohydrate kinase [Gracilinema caldarium]AEJ20115.1 Carbohydrate kinase, FGGY [Gracilinema caldarium DSM 7334]